MITIKMKTWLSIVLRGMVVLLAVLCMLLQGTAAAESLYVAVGAFFLASAVFNLVYLAMDRRKKVENPDERDDSLIKRASLLAIYAGEPVVVLISLLYSFLFRGHPDSGDVAILFVYVGASVYSVLRDIIYLHLDAADGGVMDE